MNRLLESNRVPAIFIANDVSALSLAVRRRFDFSIAFGPLPASARAKVLARHLQGSGIDREAQAKLQQRRALLPAQVATAKKVADLCGNDQAVLLQAADATMMLLEQPMPRQAPEFDFDVALAQSDCDLDLVVNGIRSKPKGLVMALHGPPGVGKSSLAQFICKQLGREPIHIAASDALSAFVGESEQRLAALFQSVDASAEVVVLEEADELLGARSSARQSWEIRLVNELLAQIDRFEGVVIITTNALDRVDPAALRRCALKVRLDHMSLDQRLEMWRRKVGSTPTPPIAQALERLEHVAAGDFTAVAQQAAIVGQCWAPEDWLSALQREVALKPRKAAQAGFIQ